MSIDDLMKDKNTPKPGPPPSVPAEILERLEAMDRELRILKGQAAGTPTGVAGAPRFGRKQVMEFLNAEPPEWEFFSLKSNTMITLHPDRTRDNSSEGLTNDHLPPMYLEMRPWESYGSDFPHPDVQDKKMDLGFCRIYQNPLVSITDKDIEAFKLPEGVEPREGKIFLGKPFYTLAKVIEMANRRVDEYSRGQDKHLLMSGAQFRNYISLLYETRWAIEDVNQQNADREKSAQGAAWKRGRMRAKEAAVA